MNSVLDKLVLDLSAMGIPTTPHTFAICMDGDLLIEAGIHGGDLVILEKRPVKPGEIVAILLEGNLTLKQYDEEQDANIQGVAVGLIRKL